MNRTLKGTVLAFVFMLTIEMVAWSATYYVDATKGDDSNAGSQDQPFRTIQKGVDKAEDGGSILVAPGHYHESVDIIQRDGLTLQGMDPNNPPIIDGADPDFTPQWEHVEGRIYRTHYVWHRHKMNDFEFTQLDGGRIGDKTPLQVWEDEVMLRGTRSTRDPDYWDSQTETCIETGQSCPYGVAGYYRALDELNPLNDNQPLPSIDIKPDMRVPGRFLYDEDTDHLYVWPGDEEDPRSHDYAIPVLFRLVDIYESSNITVKNFIITHSEGYALVVHRSRNTRVHNNYLINNLYPIDIHNADGVVLHSNFIQNHGFWEKFWYSDCKSTILWIAQVYVMASKDVDIYRNVMTNSYINARLRGNRVKFHDNIVSHAMSVHIDFDQHDASEPADFETYHNVFHDVDDSSLGLSNMAGGPTFIYRNVFYRCQHLTKEGQTTTDITLGKCHIYHNTAVFFSRISHHPYRYPVYGNIIYRNNIFAPRYPNGEYYWVYLNKDPSWGWDFFPFENGPDADYDVLWEMESPENSSTVVVGYSEPHEGVTTKVYYKDDFALLQKETGLEIHGLQKDPEFLYGREFLEADIEELNYDLLSGMDYRKVVGHYEELFDDHFEYLSSIFRVAENSPAIDNGVPLPADWPDIVDIGDGKPDIGCCEFGMDKPVSEAGHVDNAPTETSN